MASLLPDESYCTSELGRLLLKPKLDWAGRAHVIDAKETSQMGVKFVEYTCLIVMIPKQSLGLDERSFILPTRYKTMNKLHSAIQKLHSQLYLKSTFPPFPQSKWIGGNDASTIAERKAATESFITFLLSQDVLRKAQLFHTFIESAEERVGEAEIVDANSIMTVGTGLLDSSNIISSDVAPVIMPDNHFRPSSSISNDFQFEDAVIDEELRMSGQGRGFIRDYLSKFTKKNEAEDYLVVAARLISNAQSAELEGAYHSAFQSFTQASNVLLKGMESETSISNRNSVRLKSVKYMERADHIYRNHLRYDNAPLFDIRGIPRDHESEYAFRSSNSALKSFRFIGVLPDVEAKKRVLLVQEIESGKEFVMKLMERREDDCGDKIIVPTNVPHMVPLVKYFSTSSYIILLLQYVKTGRLWSFLCRYLAESEKKYEEKEMSNANEDFVESEVYNTDNPYRGRHTRFSVAADCDRLAVIENEGLEDARESAVVCSIGEDVMGGEKEGDTPKYILIPADTVDTNTMLVEEEAPAPVNICMKERKKDKKGKENDWEKGRWMNLIDAMTKCREHLKESKRCWSGILPECLIIHWSAQCISMLYVLHSNGACIGDLHPDNLLIDEEGNVLFTYQARWNNDARDRHLLAGYAAPECSLLPSLISPPCDIWSLGALLYELLCGKPLSSAVPHGIGNDCQLASIPDSSLISFSARDLLSRILEIDPLERITIDQIRAHPFYSSIDWLLYDNPHGPARGPTTRERKIEDETERDDQKEIDKRQEVQHKFEEEENVNAPVESELEELKIEGEENYLTQSTIQKCDGAESENEIYSVNYDNDLPTVSGVKD